MSLHADMTEEEFTEEMTHLVVKYGARSPESREALRFGKRHPNAKLLKIARFKIGEQERFDVENGLAGPWVRVLHFLDEEVFDRLRLGSIGQVAAVTGLVLSILFLSDRTRSWFGGPAKTPAPTVISDHALIAVANQSPSPFDAWLNRELVKAIESPQVRESLTRTLHVTPAAPAGPDAITVLRAAIMQDAAFVISLSGGSDEELAQRVQSTLDLADLPEEQKARIQKWMTDEVDRAAVMRLLRAELSSDVTRTQAQSALAAWLESPAAKAALEAKPVPDTGVTTPASSTDK